MARVRGARASWPIGIAYVTRQPGGEPLENETDIEPGSEGEAAEYLDLLQRLKADFDNFRRRSAQELAESRRAGAADFVRDLLPVLDSLERAAGSASGGDDSPALRQGLEMTLKQMRAVLHRAGVARIEAEGKAFDPSVHEAILSVPAGDRPAGIVAQVFEEGYKMGDRLLRPARVAVTADEASTPESGGHRESRGEEGTDG